MKINDSERHQDWAKIVRIDRKVTAQSALLHFNQICDLFGFVFTANTECDE